MNDRRTERNIQHNIGNLLRQSVYSRLAGYEDVNDVQRLSADSVMRAITGEKKNAASINTIGRFETKVLSLKENLDSLSQISGSWIQKTMEKTPHHRVILDVDSSESSVHGEQEDSAYNGHFGCNCYHPLFCLTCTATVKERCRVPAMSTVLTDGRIFWKRSSDDMKKRESGSTLVVMLHLHNLRFMSI